MKRRYAGGIGAAVGMLILILDGKTALMGAREGLALCIQTLIPSLFPFFFFSILLTSTLTGRTAGLFQPIGKLCGIPRGTESLVMVGLLGGYPSGAQAVGTACESGQLQRNDAARMMTFCNNAGPSFLFGVVGSMFREWWAPWLLWLLLILSALAVGAVFKTPSNASVLVPPGNPIGITAALEKSISAMAGVCGWVILFRIGLTFLQRWFLWFLPPMGQVVITGLLELSNGCIQLENVESSGLRFTLAAVMLAFGGACVTMQTCSVSGRVPMGLYLPGKLLQTIIVFLLSAAVQCCFPPEEQWQIPPVLLIICIAGAAAFIILLQKSEKNGSIRATLGV